MRVCALVTTPSGHPLFPRGGVHVGGSHSGMYWGVSARENFIVSLPPRVYRVVGRVRGTSVDNLLTIIGSCYGRLSTVGRA